MTTGSDRVVLDTMVVSALMSESRRPEPAARYWELIGGRRLIVSFSTVTEMRYGVLKAGWGELRRRSLERDLSRFVVVQPDDRLMNVCAQLRASCERVGHGLSDKIHEADRWIAATAIRFDIELVSDDAVFRDVPGLTVVTSPA